MRVIYEHMGGTCDNALSFVLRAVSKKTGLPDLQDADPVCIRLVTVYRLPIRLPAKSALTWPVV